MPCATVVEELVVGAALDGNSRGPQDAGAALPAGTASAPRVSKDAAYAAAVRTAWAADPDIRRAFETLGTADGAVGRWEDLPYEDAGTPLYGRLLRPARPNGAGVVVFHTAVGPHDLFLHWKAEALAALGYTALVADLLGDESGRGWDPAWSVPARQALTDDRALGRRRARSGVAALRAAEPGLRAVGALGFCFGGRAVLDLARLGAESGAAAVVSFHGILDDGAILALDMAAPGAPRVLVCHGDLDPFVSAAGRAACEAQLREAGARWEMLVFGGVRHGFTNPAQDLNDNPGFGYDARAAERSWGAMRELLRETLL